MQKNYKTSTTGKSVRDMTNQTARGIGGVIPKQQTISSKPKTNLLNIKNFYQPKQQSPKAIGKKKPKNMSKNGYITLQ